MRIRETMTLQQLVKVTKALADPTRFHLLQTIAERGETSCGELVRQFPLTQATISRHLKILTEAGLVEVRREGQFNYYRMLREMLDEYHQALDAALGGGNLIDLVPSARRETL
jgi:ArsR family transcriptional regulator, arsenate/arsenite/antimonite-responsive transcriptional repressor